MAITLVIREGEPAEQVRLMILAADVDARAGLAARGRERLDEAGRIAERADNGALRAMVAQAARANRALTMRSRKRGTGATWPPPSLVVRIRSLYDADAVHFLASAGGSERAADAGQGLGLVLGGGLELELLGVVRRPRRGR